MSVSVITDADIAFALKNRGNVGNSKISASGNIMFFRGNLVDSLVSHKLKIPRVGNIGNVSANSYKRVIGVQDWMFSHVGIATNDMRLYPLMENLYHNLGLSISMEEVNLPADKLSVKIFLPYRLANSRIVLGKTIQFLDYVAHLKVENFEHKCNNSCVSNYGSLGYRWYYPTLCNMHIKQLTSECLRSYANGKDCSPQYVDSLKSNNNTRIVKAIFKYYKQYRPYIVGKSICLMCGSSHVTTDYSFLTDSICSDCFKKIDWDLFQVDYKNSLISWEELFNSTEKQKKYLTERN